MEKGRTMQAESTAGRQIPEEMQRCIEACQASHDACIETMQHCLRQGGAHADPEHIRLLNDCADICRTSADFMLRMSDLHAEVCALCAEICEQCADDCERFPDDAAMQRCAGICRTCATSCSAMAGLEPDLDDEDE